MTELFKLNPLTMPLKGLQVIEASAGTGKTWTLAALYVRLVLGHVPDSPELNSGLYPPQILVMTFTDAATADFRLMPESPARQPGRWELFTPLTDLDGTLRPTRAAPALGAYQP